mmetsp:Transcript_49231/g.125001  ORF Transcript_49231/g.125001 Transcript_49231/m.125001 type:complete len:150 (-) Transcript_49231:71-520(-)
MPAATGRSALHPVSGLEGSETSRSSVRLTPKLLSCCSSAPSLQPGAEQSGLRSPSLPLSASGGLSIYVRANAAYGARLGGKWPDVLSNHSYGVQWPKQPGRGLENRYTQDLDGKFLRQPVMSVDHHLHAIRSSTRFVNHTQDWALRLNP